MNDTIHEPLRSMVRVERAERHDLGKSGIVEGPTHLTRSVTVVNLSRTGCLIRGCPDVSVGDAVRISIPTLGPRDATVRRIADDDAVGCSFDRMLKTEDVAGAIASLVDDGERVSSDAIRRMRERIAETDREEALIRKPRLIARIANRMRAAKGQRTTMDG